MGNALLETTALSSIGQIALTVRDLARATEFYHARLGLRKLFETPTMSFFDCGGVRLLLGLSEEAAPPAAGNTILYFRTDDIQSSHASMRERGVEFIREPHAVAELEDHTLWLAFFGDGEGNTLALMGEVRR